MAEDPSVDDFRRHPGPHVFVDDLDTLELADDDRHHLERSLRIREGDPFTASDGAGRWRTVIYGPQLAPGGPVTVVAAPDYEVGLAIALTKSAKPELAVQKATELGVDRVVMFHASRSVARWDSAKRSSGITRLRRVAREAAMQSRQVRIPSVTFVDDLDEVGASSETEATGALFRADFGGDVIGPDHRLIAVGPEGGWSESERRSVPASVDLGPSVLRAETAAVVAAAHMILQRRR